MAAYSPPGKHGRPVQCLDQKESQTLGPSPHVCASLPALSSCVQGDTSTLEKTSDVEEVLSANGSVAFSKAIEGRLFFSAESNKGWGIATAREGEPYEPVVFDPPLRGDAIGPSVLKTRNGYTMGLAVESGSPSKRVIEFAESESLDGTWHRLRESYSPTSSW